MFAIMNAIIRRRGLQSAKVPQLSSLKASFSSTTRSRNAVAGLFPDEPIGPDVKTAIPGPRSQECLRRLNRVFDTKSVNMLVDYEKSLGNYVVDGDGNQMLDVFAQIASIPLGYNNKVLAEVASTPEMISAIINRPALGSFPSTKWAEILETGILRAAPKGMTQVFTAHTGSDANETAYKAAFIWRRSQERGDKPFSEEEIASSMVNKAPGAPEYAILSFTGGFHGRTFGSLSTTRSKAIHKLDVPAFNWPVAPFPKIRYPLDKYSAENTVEEQRCLHETEKVIDSFPHPVAAIVVEPIQSEGGDNHASPAFFQGLRDMTAKKNILFIVDEVQTGVGATGKFWAHEHWNLRSPPDMVTFSKKAQAAGFFYHDAALRPNLPYRQFNTWMGDPARALLFRGLLGEIERLDLVNQTAKVGQYLYGKLEELSKRYPGEIENLRGKDRGTFIAWDSPHRDHIIKTAKQKGVNMGGSGERSIRLRPMLIFEKRHADLFLGILEDVFKTKA